MSLEEAIDDATHFINFEKGLSALSRNPRTGMEQRGNRKWLVLAAFAGTALVSQMLWLNFATIAITIQNRYTVDESTANLLTLVFPLLYLVFSIPSGILIDRKGYRVSVLWGSFMQAAASCIRIYDESFYALLAGQVGIAVAQPFIVNGISKLAA
ncbi:MAG TPA: MFS transporter, partial [Leptospiraceae bacterium]|nr:MFS transporter [Leptospiraceae bacterium]